MASSSLISVHNIPVFPRIRLAATVVATMLVLHLVSLFTYAHQHLNRIEVLSGNAATPGTTWLLVGSDGRDEGILADVTTHGERADAILLLHQPDTGPAALISIPRDTYYYMPGIGSHWITYALEWGDAATLVATIENMTGLTIDRYVQTGFAGLTAVVDTLGGLELCLDLDVDDANSYLRWEAGCHVADGITTIAFARMRYSDPLGDEGRQNRQRQVINAIIARLTAPEFLLNAARHRELVREGAGLLQVDENLQATDLWQLALALRAATGPGGVTGHPPVTDSPAEIPGIGPITELDPELIAEFWQKLRTGKLTPTQ